LGRADLTSPEGKLSKGVIAAVAEFEPNLLIEQKTVRLVSNKGNLFDMSYGM